LHLSQLQEKVRYNSNPIRKLGLKIDVLSMHYYEKFQELFTLRKSYNDTIVRQVALGTHVIYHNFKFTSTAHIGIPNETANEIQITLESVD